MFIIHAWSMMYYGQVFATLYMYMYLNYMHTYMYRNTPPPPIKMGIGSAFCLRRNESSGKKELTLDSKLEMKSWM